MIRRFSSVTVGFALGVFVAALGFYLTQLRAGEAPSPTRPEKNVTPFIQAPDGKLVAPPTWPNDGFGPIRTIRVDSRNSAK
ncbi:MAG TPA: hypothetical protein VEI07_10105 [Planctomycetaceae bacterium]|nr:hypothetical protein [Planctomycetaceae bacterium]